MKKKILCIVLILCMMLAFVPVVSQAAVTPHFVIINETLLPFNESTMPMVVGGDIFVPVNVLSGLNVWASGSAELELVRVFRGNNRFVDFHTAPGEAMTVNQDGVTLRWPHARRVGETFYVPIRQVSDFFGLTFRLIEIPDTIISERQMFAVRIISNSTINDPTAVGMNRDGIRRSYDHRFAPPPPPQHQPPTSGQPDVTTPPVPPPPVEEDLPPDYSDVTIYLSFYDLSAGSVGSILELLDTQAQYGVRACFFVSSEDIFNDPGMIRRISGTGHTLGIWLNEGTFEEYLRVSAILFEAAKVRTVIVSASEVAESASAMAQEHNLIFWDGAQSIVDYEGSSMATITAAIPRESGARGNLMFSGSEEAALALQGVYSYLQTNQFTIKRITETVQPISGAEY